MPEIGDSAPAFTLLDDRGTEFSLADLRGRKVILYFYPKDNTPGCATQACEFEELKRDFEDRGAVVIGVSRDGQGSHERFKAKHGLGFTLLSDPERSTHEAYGAWGEKRSYGRTTIGAIRTTVVIDEQGKIEAISKGVKAKGNAARTLALLGGG
ncbi:MAG: peroxiredoxin [Gemmatimonadetes bacterium]|nr:peroxiredoxin [Gemmatimonadota bacterium]